MKYSVILFVFFATIFFAFGQKKANPTIEYLQKRLENETKTDSVIQICIQISDEYDGVNLQKSVYYAHKAYNLSYQTQTLLYKAKAIKCWAHIHWKSAKYEDAIKYYKLFFTLKLPQKYDYMTADAYTGLGITYGRIGKINQAIACFYKSIAINERENNYSQLAKDYLNIAVDFKTNKDFAKSLEFNFKAQKLFLKLKDSLHVAIVSNNLSQIYNHLGKYQQGIAHAQYAKKYFEANGFERYTAYPLYNMGVSLDSLGQSKKAHKLYLQSVEIHNQNREPYELSNVYCSLANLYYKQKQYALGASNAQKALALSQEANGLEFKTSASKTLAKCYSKLTNFKKATYYYNQHLAYKDSLFKIEKEKEIGELYVKYETEKKEKLLAEAQASLLLKESKIRERNSYLLATISFAFLLALIGFFVYKQQRLRNKQILKEQALQQALNRIENQNNLQEQRLAISKDLHDNIGAQLTFIISSLDNLKYFEFNKEKLYTKFDSISLFTRSTITDLRDTIWAMNKETITFEDLKTRITNFIEAAKTSLRGIAFEFNYPEKMDEMALNSLKGIDVYRIIQEAVNNAVKHAKPNEIRVDFECFENQIRVVIQDNGQGFDVKTIEAGNGLLSMQKRAKAIGGVLKIESMAQGTKIMVLFGLD